MDRLSVLDRYSHYNKYLQKLGKFPMNKSITIEHLSPSSGLLQSGYKEMKKFKFHRNLIDYLCWISMLYILNTAKNSMPKNSHTTKYAEYIVNNYDMFREDANNTLRLFNKNPDLLFNWIHNENDDNNQTLLGGVEGEKSYRIWYNHDLEAFRILSCFWFALYKTDFLKESDRAFFLRNSKEI